MMIFKPGHEETYVWIWLPGAASPVVCGRVVRQDKTTNSVHRFVYGRSYREQAEAIPLLPHDLPLRAGEQPSRRGLHGVLRDAAPDAWGRRVLIYRLQMAVERGDTELTEIDYLLAGGPGTGALHFQTTGDTYQSKPYQSVSLDQLMSAAEAVEQGVPLPPELEAALLHGTSIGGARPKALMEDEGGQPLIAKFSSTSDIHPVVRLEALGLKLAQAAGIEMVDSKLLSVTNRDVLLINRFDCDSDHTQRRHFFRSLTALDLDEMEARYASYQDLADYLRRFADTPVEQCHELFRRMLFNIMIGNTDDHARNHAMFWDGHFVRLTPAYDLCVIPRIALEASQAMDVGTQGKRATLTNAFSECGRFGLSDNEAREVAERMEDSIRQHWHISCDEMKISEQLADQLWERTVLSPAIKYN
ncbi:MAG: type II toxin-antitoxin system HipA family toxin [Gammaproteobacteria bacterium]|nr:type II toxin-antitoxin system HipA family toxin [Gammaproteobacteria bacterium]